jgi:hypothetical protein
VRIAGSIFLFSGLAYAGWICWSLGEFGFHVGTTLPILMACTLIYQAYTLFRGLPRARTAGIVTALIVVITSAAILVLLNLYSDPLHPLRAALEIPSASGAVLGVLVAFAVSAVALFRARDMHPNNSLERARAR